MEVTPCPKCRWGAAEPLGRVAPQSSA